MKEINLSKERYIAALKRVRDLIANGEPLKHYDNTTPGNKNTECTWGLCSQSKATWPDPQDYLWPDDPNRVAPKYRTNEQLCPLDSRSKSDGNGCFYSCRIFKSNKDNLPTREQVLALYDARIKVMEDSLK